VVIFDNLSVHGDSFEIQVRGLSNKTRKRVPDHDRGELGDYWNTRIYRRTYFIEYKRHGDEYFRDRDSFELTDQGWRWRNTFQRVQQRANMAHVTYFVNNVANEKGQPNDQVIKEVWDYYRKVREDRQTLVDEQAGTDELEHTLPDLEANIQDSE
ncbi:MAG: hypothetical protein HRU15_00480, partial [Planctomycetes bacterium]|nr:hypothetical protein [Planctomycetota bacterium]